MIRVHQSVARSELSVLLKSGILKCTDLDPLVQYEGTHHNNLLPHLHFLFSMQVYTGDIRSFYFLLPYDKQFSRLRNSYDNLCFFHICHLHSSAL